MTVPRHVIEIPYVVNEAHDVVVAISGPTFVPFVVNWLLRGMLTAVIASYREQSRALISIALCSEVLMHYVALDGRAQREHRERTRHYSWRTLPLECYLWEQSPVPVCT